MRAKEKKSENNDNKDTTNNTEVEIILSTQEMINDARIRRHNKVKISQCNLCDFQSGSETLMTKHKNSVHKEVRYPCDQCDYAATAQDSLNEHKDSVHKEVRYPCDQCNYVATTKGSLSEHTQSYHETPKFNCNQCDYMASTKTNLNKHKEDIHEVKEKVKYVSKRIKCEKCEKKFNKKETFMAHMNKFHGDNGKYGK